MELPWYGFLLSAFGIWIAGFISGRASGQASVVQQMLLQQSKMGGMPNMPPLPGMQPGR